MTETAAENDMDVAEAPRGWRVKLYELEASGSWVDRGVGHVSVNIVAVTDSPEVLPFLCVVSEENGDFLLQSRIHCDDLYERQGESMILWKEADFSTTIDYAMSFQQPEGCAAIWAEIGRIQSEFHSEREYGYTPSFQSNSHNSFSRTHHVAQAGESQSDSESSSFTVMDDLYERDKASLFLVLPVYPFPVAVPSKLVQESEREVALYLNTLKHKLHTLHPSQRDYVSAQLLHEECSYFRRLFELFAALEDAGARCLNALRVLADVLRAVFLLNDPNLIEFLVMNDQVFHSVCGIFEYDVSLREPGQYRTFLFHTSRHVRVLDSLSEELCMACVFLYRLRYVRDVMLHPTVDDPGVSAINSMITFTSSDICVQVLSDPRHMAELFLLICPSLSESLEPFLRDSPGVLSSDTLTDDLEPPSQRDLTTPAELPRCAPHSPLTQESERESEREREPSVSLSVSQVSLSPSLSPAAAPPRRRAAQAVALLRELFSLSKFLAIDARKELYSRCCATFSRVLRHVLRFLLCGVSLSLRRERCDVHAKAENETNTKTEREIERETESDEMVLFLVQFRTAEEVLLVSTCVSEVLCALSLVCASEVRALLSEDPHPIRDTRLVRETQGNRVNLGLSPGRHWSRESLLYLLVDVTVNGTDTACVELCADTLKHLLDADKVVAPPGGGGTGAISQQNGSSRVSGKAERDRFLSDFYEHYVVWLLAPFLDSQTPSLPVATAFYLGRGVSFAVRGLDAIHEKTSGCVANTSSTATRLRSHSAQSSHALATSRRCVLELLMLCVCAHSYRAKYLLCHENHLAPLVLKAFPDPQKPNIPDEYYALPQTPNSPNAFPDVLDATLDSQTLEVLAREREKERECDRLALSLARNNPNRGVQLYTVKLLRCIVHVKDEFYSKYIVKHDVLRPLFSWFSRAAQRDNALCSAVHALVDELRVENATTLIEYCVTRHGAALERARCVDVWPRLRDRHAQLKEREMERQRDGDSLLLSLSERGKRVWGTCTVDAQRSERERESAHDELYLESGDEDDAVHGSGPKRPRNVLYARPPSPPHYSLPHGTEVDGDTAHSPRPPSPHAHTHTHSHDPLSPSPSISASLSLGSVYAQRDDNDKDENQSKIEQNDAFQLLAQYGEDLEDSQDRSEAGSAMSVAMSPQRMSIYDEDDLATPADVTEDLEEREKVFFAKLPPLRPSEEEVDQSGFLKNSLRRAQTNGAAKKKTFLKFA